MFFFPFGCLLSNSHWVFEVSCQLTQMPSFFFYRCTSFPFAELQNQNQENTCHSYWKNNWTVVALSPVSHESIKHPRQKKVALHQILIVLPLLTALYQWSLPSTEALHLFLCSDAKWAAGSEREGGRQRKGRRGSGAAKVFLCRRCFCVDRTLLYLHKSRAVFMLWDSKCCTEDFREWLTASNLTILLSQRRVPSKTSPCCDPSLISSVSCQLCWAKQICGTSVRGWGTFWNKRGTTFSSDERSRQEKRKGRDAMWYGTFKEADLSQIRDGWEAILHPHGQSWAQWASEFCSD